MVNWTEKRLTRLTQLRKAGVPATTIAKKLGPTFSKGIVLRKVHQLEAERLERARLRAARKLARAAATKLATKAAAPVVAPPKEREVIAVAPPPKQATPRPRATTLPRPPGVRLFDLRGGQCRWPVDDGRPARFFCGSPSVGASSWCDQHQRLAFTGYSKSNAVIGSRSSPRAHA
jgi:hypothetical protein